MPELNNQIIFSNQLENWLNIKGSKTLGNLAITFGERSFAVLIIVLMIIPALPLPTGGITHVFEIITMLLALEIIVGLNTLWLPKKWRNFKLGNAIEGKALPSLIKRLRWFEKWSRPRLMFVFSLPLANRLIGLIILSFTIAAFLAPPFTGLDTLPSLAVVMICLSLIGKDGLMLIIGGILGITGIILSLTIGASLVKLITNLF